MVQNFDGLSCADRSGIDSRVPPTLGGLSWYSVYCVKADTFADNPSGYQAGTTSGTNVAWASETSNSLISVTAGSLFSLTSGQFTAAWSDGLTVTIFGTRAGTPVATVIVHPLATAPMLVDLSTLANVDRVTLSSSGGTPHPGYVGGSGPHFALDDLHYILGPAHAITVTPSANGSMTCTPNLVPDGDNATCTATPDAGFAVASFTGCTATANPNECQLTNVTAPSTVSATFVPIPPATFPITVGPLANGTLACTPNPVPNGGSTTCTATPAAGYVLAGFVGCTQNGTGNTCTLRNVTAPATVSATFAAAPVAVPTLNDWALMLLGLGAAGLGARRLRRRG